MNLLESKKTNSLPTLVFLSATAKTKKNDHNSVSRFVEQAEEAGFKTAVINPARAVLRKKDNDLFVIEDDDKSIEVKKTNTIIIPRRTVLKNDESKSFLQKLENNYFFTLNSLKNFELCENKYDTYLAFEKQNVMTPKTEIVNTDSINKLQEKIDNVSGGMFPVICKILNGTQGVGVFIIDSMESLKSTLPAMFKLSPNSSIIIQEKIESDGDLRVHVLYDSFDKVSKNPSKYRIIGAMKRNKIDNDFRSNFSLGGTVEKTELTDEQKNLAIQAAIATGCRWCGVDIITDKNKNVSYVIEVNSSPGTKGISTVADVDIVQVLLDKFKHFEYFRNYENIVGRHEAGILSIKNEAGIETSIDIDTVFEFDYKLDSNCIFSNTINITGNNVVQFRINDTLYTADIYASKNGTAIVRTNISLDGNDYKYTYFEIRYSEADNKVVLAKQFIDSNLKDYHISNENWILTDKPENID